MNPSAAFVARPVATTLLAAGLTLAGAVAFTQLPVSPLPQVDYPVISVSASLPGADPETMAATVATPLERQLGRIAGVNEITSSSSLGSTRVTLQFDLNRNINDAVTEVQSAINAARSQLPSGMPNNPTYRKVNPADAPIMVMTLTSDSMTRGQMYDWASTVVAQKLSQVRGVGQVTVGGSALPAVRAELNPTALNAYGISLNDVRTALGAANANRPKGLVEDGSRVWWIYANDQARTAAEYLPLIVSYRNGAAVRLADVADVVDSVQDVRNAGEANGRPAVLLIINREPNANILETVQRIRDLTPWLQASIPAAAELGIAMERTATIRASLSEVEKTLVIAVGLVILVVFAFLRRLRATLIPAVAVPVSILISLVASLTLTPMMCARLLSPQRRDHGRLYRLSERMFEGMRRGYGRSLGWALRHPLVMVAVLAIAVGLNVYLYVSIPKGFFPQQDTGRLVGFIRADQTTSFQAMQEKMAVIVRLVRADPAVDSVTAVTGGGFGARNSGFMFAALKPLAERPSADQVVARLRPALAKVPGANLFLVPVQDLRVGGRQASGTYQYTLQSDDLDALRLWTTRLQNALMNVPQLADVTSDQETRGLQAMVVIDRPTASRMGITPDLIDQTLGNAFGQQVVSTIYTERNQYRVVMEVDPRYAQGPEALKDVYVATPNGTVPLSAVARYDYSTAPLSVNHQGQFASSTISFNLPVGVPLSEAAAAIDDTMARIGVPATVYGSFQGTARSFQSTLGRQPWLILAAILTMYIVLGMLYESTVHPLTILSTLPSAGLGALLALLAFKAEFTVIALIAVFLLIGLVKKNAILMVDFALDAERAGKAPRQAIYEACLLCFRPIMMTTMAALLGALPLVLRHGDGAELRQPLGIAIVGGLILSQLLTLYTTPVVYLYIDRFNRFWMRSVRGRLRHAP